MARNRPISPAECLSHGENSFWSDISVITVSGREAERPTMHWGQFCIYWMEATRRKLDKLTGKTHIPRRALEPLVMLQGHAEGEDALCCILAVSESTAMKAIPQRCQSSCNLLLTACPLANNSSLRSSSVNVGGKAERVIRMNVSTLSRVLCVHYCVESLPWNPEWCRRDVSPIRRRLEVIAQTLCLCRGSAIP